LRPLAIAAISASNRSHDIQVVAVRELAQGISVNDLRDLRAKAEEEGNAAMASGTAEWPAAPGSERAIVCLEQG